MHDLITFMFWMTTFPGLVWLLVVTDGIYRNTSHATTRVYLEGVAPCVTCFSLVFCFCQLLCQAYPDIQDRIDEDNGRRKSFEVKSNSR